MIDFKVSRANKKIASITHNGKEVSKQQAAILVYRAAFKDESLTPAQIGKIVKTVLVEQLDMSGPGSNTYIANAKRNVVHGGDTYLHNKNTNKKAQDRKALLNAATMADTVNTKVKLPTEVKKPVEVAAMERWRVENKDTKELLSSFATRSAAQKYNKDHTDNTRWFDGAKAA